MLCSSDLPSRVIMWLSVLELKDWDGPTGPTAISAARSLPEYAGCGDVFGVFWFEMRQAAVRALLRYTAQLPNNQSSRHSAGKLDQCVRHVGIKPGGGL